MKDKVIKITQNFENKKISEQKYKYNLLLLCGVVKSLKDKQYYRFMFWKEAHKIKQIGKTSIYKQGSKTFYEYDILKMYNKNKNF